MTIREATIEDIPHIWQLIKDLAEYERSLDQVVASEADLANSFFSDNPKVFCHVATENDQVVGVAIWFLNYSTWLGKHGMYLEDLFVSPAHRSRGHGMALLKKLAQICLERKYERFQWWVLDWNLSAIEFYKSIGSVAMDEWTVFRLSGEELKKLGRS